MMAVMFEVVPAQSHPPDPVHHLRDGELHDAVDLVRGNVGGTQQGTTGPAPTPHTRQARVAAVQPIPGLCGSDAQSTSARHAPSFDREPVHDLWHPWQSGFKGDYNFTLGGLKSLRFLPFDITVPRTDISHHFMEKIKGVLRCHPSPSITRVAGSVPSPQWQSAAAARGKA